MNVRFTIYSDQNPQPTLMVYALYNSSNEYIFLGIGEFGEIHYLADAKKNPRFANCFPDGVVNVHILGGFTTRIDAFKFFMSIYNQPNMQSPPIMHCTTERPKAPVKCIDTGEVFESLTHCSKAHGINASNLSKHLRGHKNYRTVKQRRYEYAKQAIGERGWYSPY